MSEYTVTIQRAPIKITFIKIGLHMFPFNDEFQKIRYKEQDKKCHLCKTDFRSQEQISIGFVKKGKNHMLCEACASHLIHQGVDYIDRGGHQS